MWEPEQKLSEKFVNEFSNAHMDYVAGKIGWRVYGRFRLVPHYVKSNEVALCEVHVPKEKRGQGIGSSLLDAVTYFCDMHKLKCTVFVEPYDSEMTLYQLKKWYRRFGFKSVPKEKHLMVYRPN